METPQLFRSFKRASLVVVGDVMLDRYLEGSSERISPEAPVPIFKFQHEKVVLGGAANTAANISSLGGKVSLLGLIGKDTHGALLKKLCKNHKISFFPQLTQAPTITKTRIIGGNQQMLRIDKEEHTVNNHIPDLIKKTKSLLKPGDVLLFSDYNKGCLTEDFCQVLINHCKKNKILVIADPKPVNINFFKNCDYLTPNWKESQEIAHLFYAEKSLSNLTHTASLIYKKTKSKVIMTLGPDGLFYFPSPRKPIIRMSTLAREVFDVSGAGDTFIAAFSLCKASGIPDNISLNFANRASGIVVKKQGTALAYPQDFKESDSIDILSKENSFNKNSSNFNFQFDTEQRLLEEENSLKKIADMLHKSKHKIVSLNGSFDLLHAGHLYILSEAKKQGDVLVIGLNSDSSIKKYKSPHLPIIDEKNRAQMLLALHMVDFVYIFPQINPLRFISLLKPHVHVNGAEYGKNCIEAPLLKKIGAELLLVKRIPQLASSDIIRKIKTLP